MKSKPSLDIMYCYDAMYSELSNPVNPEEYPYMMVIALHDRHSNEIVENPIMTRKESGFYLNTSDLSPTTFNLMNITSHKAKGDVYKLSDVKPKIFKAFDSSFHRGDEMTDTFFVDFSCVATRDEEYHSMREHISTFETNKKEKYLYSTRGQGIDIDDSNYRLRSIHGSAIGLDDKYVNNNNVIVFDPHGYYNYMFDKRFEKRVVKDIEHDVLKVTDVYLNIEHTNLNSATKFKMKTFFAHVLVFKSRSRMEDYGRYFMKKYDRDCYFGMHSSVDDPVNNRVRKLRTLKGDLNIITGPVSNRAKSYQVKFDWDYVLCEDMYDDIVKEINEGTFYTDKKIGKNTQNLEDSPIYIDEEKFINKMKLQTKWKKCIDSIVVNDNGK